MTSFGVSFVGRGQKSVKVVVRCFIEAPLKRHSRIVRRPGRTCKHVRAPRWALFERDEAMGEATGSYASADYERG